MKFCAVILAAGLGKRMQSRKPKVLHEVLGRPMLRYAVDSVKALHPEKLVIVIGNGAGEVKKQIKDKEVSFVIQKELLGTGNALAAARKVLKDLKDSSVLVLNGDSPLMTRKTLQELLRKHKSSGNDLSFLSFIDDAAPGYGRVLRNKKGGVVDIVEDKHADPEQKKINELNGGVYIMEARILNYLRALKKHDLSGEYYITDLVGIASGRGKKVNAYQCPPEEVKGVNTRQELYQASGMLNRRIISEWMEEGVTFINPETTIVHSTVSIGKDCTVYPNTCLEGNTSIGNNCVIRSGARISNSIIGEGVYIKDCTIIENSSIGDMLTIGPLVHINNNKMD